MESVPNRLYYKIGEVCDLCQIQPHVLRYWETEFSQLSPSKNNSGQRVYRFRELQMVRRIKQLLYDEGYTIAGANKKLAAEHFDTGTDPLPGPSSVPQPPEAPPSLQEDSAVVTETLPLFAPQPVSPPHRTPAADEARLLEEIRSELEQLLHILD